MGRTPNAEREGWEDVRALASKGLELHRFGRLCADPRERARLHRDEHRVTLQALELVADLHQQQWRPMRRAKTGNQLRLVA